METSSLALTSPSFYLRFSGHGFTISPIAETHNLHFPVPLRSSWWWWCWEAEWSSLGMMRGVVIGVVAYESWKNWRNAKGNGLRRRDGRKGKGKEPSRGSVKGNTKEKRSMWKESCWLMDRKKRERNQMEKYGNGRENFCYKRGKEKEEVSSGVMNWTMTEKSKMEKYSSRKKGVGEKRRGWMEKKGGKSYWSYEWRE